MDLKQIGVGLASLANQASEQAIGFGGWVSEKTGELKVKFSEVVWPSVITPLSVEKNNDIERAQCPLGSAPPFPYTGSVEENNKVLENVLSAMPQTYTGRFNGMLANTQKLADGTKAETVPLVQTNKEEEMSPLLSPDESPQSSAFSLKIRF